MDHASNAAAPRADARAAPPQPLAIVCFAFGELYGMADLYLARLFDMLGRHCRQPFTLVCYADRPRRAPHGVLLRDCRGWTELERAAMRPTTRKLGLFNPNYVEFDEFLYLDLSLVIRQDMDALLAYAFSRDEDLVIVDHWHYQGYNSSVMRIRRGPLRSIYDAFVDGVAFSQTVPGDQDFVHGAIAMQGLQQRVALFPTHQIVSFKKALGLIRRQPESARLRVQGATIVKFHGQPKMHEAFQPRYRLKIRVRELVRGNLRPVIDIGELRRQWMGAVAS